MPGGRPTKLTPAIQKEIARLFFLCFTDEQVAFCVGVNQKTIQRARRGEFCPAIKKAEMEREANYRQRTWDGAEGWQGAAWNLERKYPKQYSKPELQLQINTTNQTVNNTLIVTAEVAHGINSRVKDVDAKIERLLKDKGRGNGNGNSHPPEEKKGGAH
jgi:hypothetical protein